MTRTKRDLAIIFLMATSFFVWIVFSLLRIDYKTIEAIRGNLPTWVPLANLLLAPFLAAIAAGSLPISSWLRLVVLLMTLCSFSLLYLSLSGHQLTTIVFQVLLYIEAFWLIPKWNRWSERRETGQSEAAWAHLYRKRLGWNLRDTLAYIGIAVVLVSMLVLYVLRHN